MWVNVLVNNIVNVDIFGYKVCDIDFQEMLKLCLGEISDSVGINGIYLGYQLIMSQGNIMIGLKFCILI